MEERAQSASDVSDDVPYRRRGRPIGKNRVPLSLKERRARNAQYERERRFETSAAMADLAKAADCDPTLSNSDILVTVIGQLQRAANIDSSREIEELKRTNEKLIRQVEALEQRLSNWEDNNQCSHEDGDKPSTGGKRKRKSTKSQNKKYAKALKSKQGSFPKIRKSSSDSNIKLTDYDACADEELEEG